MQIFSWPEPPKPRGSNPPAVPLEYTSFGITYSAHDKAPVSASFARMRFDKSKVKDLINISFSTFIKLISCPLDHERLIGKIRDVHSEINQLLNDAKRIEAAGELERIRREHILNKNMIIGGIKRQMSDFKIE